MSKESVMENGIEGWSADVQASVGDVESLPALFKLIAECGSERDQLIAEALSAMKALDEKALAPPLELPEPKSEPFGGWIPRSRPSIEEVLGLDKHRGSG